MGYLPSRSVEFYLREKCVAINKAEKLEIFNPFVITFGKLQDFRFSLLEFSISLINIFFTIPEFVHFGIAIYILWHCMLEAYDFFFLNSTVLAT